jgi:hypothetical protein
MKEGVNGYGLFDAAENSGDTEAPISRLRE